MISIFLNSRKMENLLIDINLNGSNAEKMSNIIQNMELPFIALKAISLFNLMF